MDTDVIQKTTKDGKYRITVRIDECAENPIDMFGCPLNVCDWDKNYYLYKHDNNDFISPRVFLEYLIVNYVDYDKIIDVLVENGKHLTDGKSVLNNALVYDRGKRAWIMKEYSKHLYDNGFKWRDSSWFLCKKQDINLDEILDASLCSTIDYIVEHCMTDKVKIAGYSFGYYGEIGFHDNFSCDSTGIAYLIKDECVGDGKWFTEEQWSTQSFMELIKAEIEEIKAWSEGCVYYYDVEKSSKYIMYKECISEQKPLESYTVTEWENIDSCGGYYGNPQLAFEDAMYNNNLKAEEFDD